MIKRISKRVIILAVVATLVVLITIKLSVRQHPPRPEKVFLPYDPELFAKIKGSPFEGFNNITGTPDGSYIVPNYVHFIFFEISYITYVTAVCVLAAFKNQNPDKIFFHTNVKEFSGPHWIKIRDTLGNVLEVRHIDMPTTVFGQKFRKEWIPWHSGDVMRIKILMQYGGIFLDNDSYIVRNLDVFRRYEMTIGITDREYLGSQVIIANKDARFLKLWVESYRIYHPEEWYMNAGEKPMKEILAYRPDLVHTMKTLFGVRQLTGRLFEWDSWNNWRKYYTIHLVIRFRKYSVSWWHYMLWPTIDETNICEYKKPFGEMARDVYPDFCQRQ